MPRIILEIIKNSCSWVLPKAAPECLAACFSSGGPEFKSPSFYDSIKSRI